jgi:NADPH:quinone reductase-like Zn-dependent oxidoreductase
VARRLGAKVFATAGTAEKRAYLETLGIEAVLDSRTLAFADQVRRLTGGRGVDVILNSLPGPAIARATSTTTPGWASSRSATTSRSSPSTSTR